MTGELVQKKSASLVMNLSSHLSVSLSYRHFRREEKINLVFSLMNLLFHHLLSWGGQGAEKSVLGKEDVCLLWCTFHLTFLPVDGELV